MSDIIKAIERSEIILIDTSSLMNYSNLDSALKRIKPILIEENKKIHITAQVSLELLKHATSKDGRKKYRAKKAEEIIDVYKDIFFIDDYSSFKSNGYYVFADATLLSKMIINRAHFSQLLITNDKGLSEDALNINNSKSCFGKQVFVYSVSKQGEFEEVIIANKIPSKQKNNQTIDCSQSEKVFTIISFFALGVIVGKGGAKYLKCINNLNWRSFI